ncbi:ankyrin [Dendrothele bispora CBS 962.96]|uniref:Ankyrin n=1 Tax=Dendrothele bispora (strain CBS 962.96) TaxID=1314807 RepID=A0A4S8L2L7_DENBC|nr:ankyrin [Dendrothele bispora CBS 962.96]
MASSRAIKAVRSHSGIGGYDDEDDSTTRSLSYRSFHVLRLTTTAFLPMDDPTALVSTQSELAASSVTQESAVITNLSFSQEQTIHNPEANIFVAAQRGDVELIRQLIAKSGQVKTTDCDKQSITPPLGCNQHSNTSRILLDQGAEVDALGGYLVAIPIQWAARNSYLPINVDSRDAQGRTSLMWAAYQGDALYVYLLLHHWCQPEHRGLQHGADLTAKDAENRTARDMAIELKSLGAWKRAMEEGGMNEYGAKRTNLLAIEIPGSPSF